MIYFSSGRPNFASSEATKMSESKAISKPPPRANPFTPEITGFFTFENTFSTSKIDSSLIDYLNYA